MLIEFSVKNFRSIRDRATLSMAKGSITGLEDTNTFDPSVVACPTLLSSMAMYGANASGKSNVIKALDVMQDIIFESANYQIGDLLPVESFKLNHESQETPTEFEMVFISEGKKYQYGFTASKELVQEEWLFSFESHKGTQLIERYYDADSNTSTWGKMSALKGEKTIWKKMTRTNNLFLSRAVQLNSKQLEPVLNWFRKNLHVLSSGGRLANNYTITKSTEEGYKDKIIEFLRVADFGIENYAVEEKEVSLDELPKNLVAAMPEKMKDKLLKGELKTADIKTFRLNDKEELVSFDFEDEESEGTQKYFSYAGPWIDVLENGYTFVIDELNNRLHPLLVVHLIQMFHDKGINKKNAQLIFTAHDTHLLNQEIFRRDQIWFCEKNKIGNTELFSLLDFNPRKGVENIEQGYLSGRYGALPYLQSIKEAMDCEDG